MSEKDTPLLDGQSDTDTGDKDGDKQGTQDGSHKADDGKTKDGLGGTPLEKTEGKEGLGGEKPDADKGKEGDGNGDAGKKDESGAPEKYEGFTLEEGFELNEAQLATFTSLAKELNLSQGQAQKLVDYYVKILKDEFQTQETAFTEDNDKWLEEAKKDTEFGGAKFDENLKIANTALTKFATDEVADLLVKTGLSMHPEIIRMFFKIGQTIGEDTLVEGKQTDADRLSDGNVLFGGKGK